MSAGPAQSAVGSKAVSVADLRRVAKRNLPSMIFDYLDGGALDEVTLRANESDLAALRFQQRILQDMSGRDTTATVLGHQLSLPVMVSPMGLLGLFHPQGDLAAARAAKAAGTVFVSSAWSSTPLAEVVAAAPGAVWSQIAFWVGRDLTEHQVRSARTAGVEVLVVAGDVGMSDRRERDAHHGFGMPMRPTIGACLHAATKPRWLWNIARSRGVSFANFTENGRRMPIQRMGDFMHDNDNPASTWDDVSALREQWPGKLVIKGVMTAQDAEVARGIGVDGVIVSNLGGRQFDAQTSTARALPDVVDQLRGSGVTVFVDGGIRRGGDILKLLALGADACLIGRPAAYGLAAAGQHGVAKIIDVLHEELLTALGNTGTRSVADCSPALLT